MSHVVPQWMLRWSERGVRAIVCITAALATTGLVLAHLGVYRWWSLVPAVAVSTAVLMRLWDAAATAIVDPDDDGWAWIVGMVGIAAITVFHARYSGNFIFISRDPAFYNLVGIDLARTGDLAFDGASGVLAGVANVRIHSQGLVEADGVVYTQGFHGLEAILAPTEWIGGVGLFLRSTALLGGACLLVFRRVAVRLSGPWPATVVTVALGLSLPFLEFTRNPYSEIPGLLFVLAALLVLLERPFTPAVAGLAAFVSGAAMAVRIDALLVISGSVFAIALVPGVVERRWPRRAELAAVAVGAGTAVALGLFVGYERSPRYTSDLSGQMKTQVAVVGAIMAGLAGLYAIRWLGPRWRSVGEFLGRPRVAAVAAGAVVAAGVAYWFVVPLLTDFHGGKNFPLAEGLQSREFESVDGRRTYGEEALPRLAMIYGSVTVLLAVVGAGIAVHRLLRHRDRVQWILIGSALPSVAYLVDPKITPDLPWAMRRFLPVVIPVMLLLAAVALTHLRERFRSVPLGAAAVLALVVAAPAAAIAPVAGIRGEAEGRGFVEAICREIPDGAGVFVGHERLRVTGIQTIEVFCGVDAVTATDGAPADTAAAVAGAWDTAGIPVVLVLDPGAEVPAGLREQARVPLHASTEFVMRTIGRLPPGGEFGSLDADVVRVVVDR